MADLTALVSRFYIFTTLPRRDPSIAKNRFNGLLSIESRGSLLFFPCKFPGCGGNYQLQRMG
ncbi:MAG: hypothetical protein RLP02_40530 [Coleofasciculus sp. C2-GNP5-27]